MVSIHVWTLALSSAACSLIGAPHAAAAPTAARAQTAIGEPLLPDPLEMKRVEAAVDKALLYLASHQDPDGSWPSGIGKNNGINAISLLAFLGRGHVPGRGPFKHTVDRAVDFIVATQDPQTGLFKSPDPTHGPMYEHALATLAIIEAYGFMPSSVMRRRAQSAVDLIIKAQSPNGGWRYQPVPGDHDLSVTVMQVVALRAAMNARLDVPDQKTKLAVAYVRSCAVKDGGFAYQPGQDPKLPLSAAGVLCLQLLGEFDDPAVEKGLTYLHNAAYDKNMEHFFYMNYYAMQAAFQAGGDHWARWHPKVRKFLLENQNEDGSWPGYKAEKFNGPARCYSTGFSAICLEVYMHFLPVYQR